MGFGKKTASNEGKAGTGQTMRDGSKFVPSTRADLKRYAKNAKKFNEAKKERGADYAERAKLRLERNLPVKKILPKATARMFRKLMDKRIAEYAANKKNDKRWTPSYPQYDKSLPRRLADTNFVYDVQVRLAHFDWKELSLLVNAGSGTTIVTKNFSEAFHFAESIVHQALGVELADDETSFHLSDLERVLELWPITVIDRSKKMTKRDSDAIRNGKLRASKPDEDEEDDDEAEAEGGGDTEEEEEEEEEEEAPKPKKSKAAKKEPDEEDDEDESEDESDDDENEDDEDEKPIAKKTESKKSKESPVKSKSKKVEKTVEKHVKSKKSTKPTRPEKAEKPKAKSPAAKVKKDRAPRNAAAIFKPKKKFEGGVREQCYAAVPAKGATVDEISSIMKKRHGTDPKKTRNYVNWLTSNGNLTRIDE